MGVEQQRYTVRQATEADLPALTDIKCPLALHTDRLRDADGDKLLYMVVDVRPVLPCLLSGPIQPSKQTSFIMTSFDFFNALREADVQRYSMSLGPWTRS